jgi:hypothetical protein
MTSKGMFKVIGPSSALPTCPRIRNTYCRASKALNHDHHRNKSTSQTETKHSEKTQR